MSTTSQSRSGRSRVRPIRHKCMYCSMTDTCTSRPAPVRRRTTVWPRSWQLADRTAGSLGGRPVLMPDRTACAGVRAAASPRLGRRAPRQPAVAARPGCPGTAGDGTCKRRQTAPAHSQQHYTYSGWPAKPNQQQHFLNIPSCHKRRLKSSSNMKLTLAGTGGGMQPSRVFGE